MNSNKNIEESRIEIPPSGVRGLSMCHSAFPFLISILTMLFSTSTFSQSSPYFQQKVDYNIIVSLNDNAHTLDGYISMQYQNNSPDTLHYIWFHLWPNAYKNDRTAFSDQFLENGKTNFYFSNEDKRGYINRLDFKVDKATAFMEDHPQQQDIIKLILPKPIAPGTSTKIETAFHVKLPYNVSRGGHQNQSYQITQWYPKPAVYDKYGWHEMPYLDQGEFYSEFGNYKVQITLPKNYVVAATGELQNEDEQKWMLSRTDEIWGNEFRKSHPGKKIKNTGAEDQSSYSSKDSITKYFPPSDSELKTLEFTQDNIHDFAWFADKRFVVEKDSLQSATGKTINCFSYYLPFHSATWKNSSAFIKKSIAFHNEAVGEYPYTHASAVDIDVKYSIGMEYPMITSISQVKTRTELELTIEHEVGHNWFYGILASNERLHPWMDEGMNSYYDNRYLLQYKTDTAKPSFMRNHLPADEEMLDLLLNSLIKVKKDQPIETPSEKFSELNYGAIAYHKTALWMKQLETTLGKPLFDSLMHEYYKRWKFKHPYPEDFKNLVQEISQQNVDVIFSLLDQTGDNITHAKLNDRLDQRPPSVTKKIKIASFFSLKDSEKYHYILVSPAIGYNYYDKFMAGILIHNYTLPSPKFRFILAPLYATNSKQFNGIGNINYSSYSYKRINKIVIGATFARFSTNQSLDTSGNKILENFYKVVPYLQLHFRHPARSHITSWFDLRTYLIGQQNFNRFEYKAYSDSTFFYPTATSRSDYYINQLSFNVENSRVLYPYDYQLKLQQGKGFYRFDLTADYLFNYSKGGGLQARLFASKFGYLSNDHNNGYQYRPKLLAATGEEDYTYSNYFLGRTASTAVAQEPVKNLGVGAQQIMIRDGGLKLRVDQFGYLQGASENWVAALNVNTTLPNIFPVKLPIRLFFDIGTYAEGWKENATTSKFLYVGGLQLSLFKNVFNIYAPLVYNKEFKDGLKTDPERNKFFKKLTFSINVQNISFKKNFPQISF